MTKIFENITILELSDSAGEYTGKLFAGMGAHVIKVEPPKGSKSRKVGPFYQNIPNLNSSLKFFQNNINKDSITLDITKQTGFDIFLQLLQSIDILSICRQMIDNVLIDCRQIDHMSIDYR